jgi:hypothetical protein
MTKRAAANRSPTETNWLYACPLGLPTSAIASYLDVVSQPITEVSARNWQHDWDMANAFMEAYGYPLFELGEPVHFDRFKDYLLNKETVSERDVRGRLTQLTFLGETVIVRDSAAAAEGTLAFLLDVVSFKLMGLLNSYYFAHENPSDARVVLVLEGWDKPLVAGRVAGHRVAWQVNQMPTGQQGRG